MDKITKINALISEKMNFSTLGIRSELKDYELAYWLNLYFDIKLIARGDATDFQIGQDIYEYNVFDGLDHKGEGLCMVTNVSSGAKKRATLNLNLFESIFQKKRCRMVFKLFFYRILKPRYLIFKFFNSLCNYK